jgi:hypothetical protein
MFIIIQANIDIISKLMDRYDLEHMKEENAKAE